MAFLSNLFKWLPFGSVAEISADELMQLRDKKFAQIIDVRTPTEWKASAIPDSNNLPITQFSQDAVNDLQLDKNKPVIAICLSAHRSIPAVRILKEMGFQNAKQLKGGMKAWWKQDFPCKKQ